ncbi:hypothetical protein [Sphingosinicella sp.]|uniref:hypothetical protein n=1 Tax=Sphingosinicella sp. TaxID=1917971 RepID=UPI0035B4F524
MTDVVAFLAALASGAPVIKVSGRVEGLPSFSLQPGQVIVGDGDTAGLAFAADGIVLTANNTISGLALLCPAECCALRIAADAACGRIALADLHCEGIVHLVFTAANGDTVLYLRNLFVSDADASACLPRPFGNGVEVQQGALTIWNRSETDTTIAVDARGLRIGDAGKPVRGTGLFVAGQGETGRGKVVLERFETGDVHSDSGLPEGTTQTVSGGIFFLFGVEGDEVGTIGDVSTRGANAVPIDTWARLGLWTVDGNVRSFGPSAVGFVNAGDLGTCKITGTLETFGDGARACCIYGPTGSFVADTIRTHGRAATGVQVVNRLERLQVRSGLFTAGDAGEGLVKGRMVATPAHGVEVEAGGYLGELDSGVIEATGRDALAVHVEGTLGAIVRPRL